MWNIAGESNSRMDLIAMVDKYGRDLTWWNRNVFGNVRRDLDRLKKLLAKAELVVVTSGNNFRVWQLKFEINVLLDKEATMWAQRSRLLWVKNGDGTQNISILGLPKGLGGIGLWVLEMSRIHGGFNRRK